MNKANLGIMWCGLLIFIAIQPGEMDITKSEK